MPHIIFVYGTLKHGHRNAHINQGVRVPGEFVTVERFPLHVIGPTHLPWLVARPGQGEAVVGELYEVDDAALARMDALERLTEPDWYTRAEIAVRRRGDPQAPVQQAWVYFGSAARLHTETVHSGPLVEYTLDHAARRSVPPLHPFDAAMALAALAPDEFEGRTHADYANMVGPFGGVTAAVLLNAACLHPQRLGDPLALTVNYAGPVADGPFRILARPVRTNRSTQHWVIEQRQGDAVCTTATALFGTRRATWTDTEARRPAVPPAVEVASRRSPIPLAWMGRYELRPVAGAVPDPQHATPQDDSVTTLWIRDQPARPLDVLSLVALSDNFYPRVFRRLGRALPAGTISMTTYLHADAAGLAAQGDRPVLATAWGQQFGGGYFDQSAQLWAEQGGLLASSHQLVYFKE